MELNELVAIAEAAIPYTPKNYPALEGLEGKDVLVFAINHTLLHQQKQMGRLAAILEDHDHNSAWTLTSNQRELEIIGVKLLMNAIQLCSLVGMTGDHAGDLAKRLFPPRN